MKIQLIALTLALSLNSYACEVIRAAFDVGSGTTKMKVYHYDYCENKIIQQIEELNGKSCEENRKISYKEDLKDSNTIKSVTITKGSKALAELKDIALNCGAEQFAGVATSAFRLAANGSTAIKELAKKSKISLTIISQKEEAEIGLKGVAAKVDLSSSDNICVWDIGGSSAQITCSDENENIRIYEGKLASISFRDTIIDSKIDSKDSQALQAGKATPNPISQDEYTQALSATEKEGSQVRRTLGNSLANSKVFGIGGVHYYAVSKEIGEKKYTADQIQLAITDRLAKTDEELGGGDYVDTAVSNMILVEGMMRSLNISSVSALKINLTEGLVVSEDYWQ